MGGQRRLGILIAVSGGCWLATIIVALVMILYREESGALGVVEDLLRAGSATVTVAGAVVYRASLASRSRFEQGYLAAQRDARPIRVMSIASHVAVDRVPIQDRKDSN